MIDLTIDGERCSVPSGTTILEAARGLGISIPTLCYHPGLPPEGNCRLCSVEIRQNNRSRIVMSCMFPVEQPGIEVITFNERIRKYRAFIIEMLLKRTPGDPYLKDLAREYDVPFRPNDKENSDDRCILCGLCVRACEAYGSSALSFINRGWEREVSTPFSEPSLFCVGCGACAEICPVNAISMEDKDGIRTIWGREFVLQKCRICGRYFATKEQLEQASDGQAPDLICERCKRLEEARVIGKAITRS